ncbi:MAG: hypothetical protein WBC44_03800 [Planctomycetaceae bacterium]
MRRFLLLFVMSFLALAAAPLRGDDEYDRMKIAPELVDKAVAKYPEKDRAYYRRRWIEDFDAAGKELFDAQRDIVATQAKLDAFNRRYIAAVESKGFDEKYDRRVVIPFREGSTAAIARLRKQEQRLTDLRLGMLKSSPIYIPELPTEDFRVGRVGTFPGVKILGIESDSSLKVRPVDHDGKLQKGGEAFVLTNVPTDRVDPGDVVPMRGEIVRIIAEKEGMFVLRVIDDKLQPFGK